MHMRPIRHARARAKAEDGFTFVVALIALVVSGALVAAALAAVNGDIFLSGKSTARAKAYYSAAAGAQRYLQELHKEPNYWVKCPTIKKRPVPNSTKNEGDETGTEEEYTVQTLPAHGYSKCLENVQPSVLETGGNARGTFRILITAIAGKGSAKTIHKTVAVFSHPGFTRYVYETNFEVEDPTNFSPEPSGCEHYWKERVEKSLTSTCQPIEFAPEDKVNGPMHTNDAAELCASGGQKPTFGREGHEDAIEMLQGHYAASGCSNEAKINGNYTTEAEQLLPPATDSELLESAGLKLSGRTEIELKSGTPGTMLIKNQGVTKTVEFPSNGVVYVENSSSGCSVAKYSPFKTNTTSDTGCGNVYVHGTYSESLTIASADDVIVNGNLTTSGGSTGGEPTGSAELGLIAENFVRLYHPVQQEYEVTHKAAGTKTAVGTKQETCFPTKYTGTPKEGSTTVSTMSSTEGLSVGLEVTGSGIEAGTTIKEVKASESKIVLSKAAKSSKSTTLTFVDPSAGGKEYEYRSGVKKCVEKTPTGYTLHEAELLFAKACNTNSGAEEQYTSNGKCEYTNTSKACDAENANATEDPNKWGALNNPIIDAAILSTKHSWIVDNYKCGAKLGEITVWGSIAQYWRGPVGTGGGTGTGYIKNYNYDQRLFTQEPPNFLTPISATWKLARESEVSCTYYEEPWKGACTGG